MKPTRKTLLLLGLGLLPAALPLLLGRELWLAWLACVACLAVALAADALYLLRRRPRIQVEVPPSVGVGERVRVRVWVQEISVGSIQLRPETEAPLQPGHDLRLKEADGGRWRYLILQAPRRGTGALTALWVRATAPLGLLEWIGRAPVKRGRVSVVPSLPRVRRLAIKHFGDWRPRGGRHQCRLRGVGSEFDALEAYVPGMDPRHFDWNASARHQALLVRRYRVEQNQRILLCLDTGRLMGDPIEGLQRLDHAITAALLLSFFALRDGDQVGLHAYAGRTLLNVPPVAGIRRMQTLIQACSGLEVQDEETNHALGLRELLTHLNRRTLVVVFTEFTDTTSAELMIDYLGQVARQHLVIFCSLEDPILTGSFNAPPLTLRRMADAVAADTLHTDRAAVLSRLRRKGIRLVSSPPGEAAAQLVMNYTDIKRRELIG